MLRKSATTKQREEKRKAICKFLTSKYTKKKMLPGKPKKPPKHGPLPVFKSLARVNPALDKDYMTATPSEYKIRFTIDWVEKAAKIPKDFLSDPIEGSELAFSVSDSESDGLDLNNEEALENQHRLPSNRQESPNKEETKATILKLPPKHPQSSSEEENQLVSHKHHQIHGHSTDVEKLIRPIKQLQPVLVYPRKNPALITQRASSSSTAPTIPARGQRRSSSEHLSNKSAQEKQKQRKTQRRYKTQAKESRAITGGQISKPQNARRRRSKVRNSSKPRRNKSVGNSAGPQKLEYQQKGIKSKDGKTGRSGTGKKFTLKKSNVLKPRLSSKIRKPKGRESKENKKGKVTDSHEDVSEVSERYPNRERNLDADTVDEHSPSSHSSAKSEARGKSHCDPVKTIVVEEPVVKLFYHELTSDSSSPDGIKHRPKKVKQEKKPKSILRQTLYYGKLPSQPDPHTVTPQGAAGNQGDALVNVPHHVEGETSKTSLHDLNKELSAEFAIPEAEVRPERLTLDGDTVEYEDGFRSLQENHVSNTNFVSKAKPSLAKNPRLDWKRKPKPAVLFFHSTILPDRRNLILKTVPLLPLEEKLRAIYEENDEGAEIPRGKRFDTKMFASKTGSSFEVTRPKVSQLTLPSDSRSDGHPVSRRGSVLHPQPPENSHVSSDYA